MLLASIVGISQRLPAAAVQPLCRLERKTSDSGAEKVVGVGLIDLDRHDIARAQGAARLDVDRAVDLRRVVFGAALCAETVSFVDDDRQALADLLLQLRGRNLLLRAA